MCVGDFCVCVCVSLSFIWLLPAYFLISFCLCAFFVEWKEGYRPLPSLESSTFSSYSPPMDMEQCIEHCSVGTAQKEGQSQEEFNQEVLNQEELNQDEINQEELNQDEINQEEINKEDLNQKDLNQKGLSQEELNKKGLDQEDLDQEGLNQEGSNQEESNQEELNQEGVSQEGVSQEGQNQGELNHKSLNKKDLNQQEPNKKGLNQKELPQKGQNQGELKQEGLIQATENQTMQRIDKEHSYMSVNSFHDDCLAISAAELDISDRNQQELSCKKKMDCLTSVSSSTSLEIKKSDGNWSSGAEVSFSATAYDLFPGKGPVHSQNSWQNSETEAPEEYSTCIGRRREVDSSQISDSQGSENSVPVKQPKLQQLFSVCRGEYQERNRSRVEKTVGEEIGEGTPDSTVPDSEENGARLPSHKIKINAFTYSVSEKQCSSSLSMETHKSNSSNESYSILQSQHAVSEHPCLPSFSQRKQEEKRAYELPPASPLNTSKESLDQSQPEEAVQECSLSESLLQILLNQSCSFGSEQTSPCHSSWEHISPSPSGPHVVGAFATKCQNTKHPMACDFDELLVKNTWRVPKVACPVSEANLSRKRDTLKMKRCQVRDDDVFDSETAPSSSSVEPLSSGWGCIAYVSLYCSCCPLFRFWFGLKRAKGNSKIAY